MDRVVEREAAKSTIDVILIEDAAKSSLSKPRRKAWPSFQLSEMREKRGGTVRKGL